MKKHLILVFVATAIMAASFPAMAVSPPSYTFQMGARMLTDVGWWQRDNDAPGVDNGSADVGTWFLNMPGWSYIQARFYSVDKNVGGRIELGLRSLNGSATTELRHAYGYWRVGKFRVLAGQTTSWFASTAYYFPQFLGMNENGHLLLFGWGVLWGGRVPQVQFTYNTEQWGIQLALEEPRVNLNWFSTGTDSEFSFPRASLTAMFKSGGFMTHPGISYVNHAYEDGGSGAFDGSYVTWAAVLPVKYAAGPFVLRLQAHYGINYAIEFPFYPLVWTRPYRKNITSGGIEDTTVYGGGICGSYMIHEMEERSLMPTWVSVGFGYESFQNDAWSASNGYSQDENHRWSAFISLPYFLTKNFSVRPEFGYYDWGNSPQTGDDLGYEWLLGVHFHFIF